MSRHFKGIVGYLALFIALIIGFTALFSTVNPNVSNVDNNLLVTSYKQNDTEVKSYTTYRKFYNEEVADGEHVSFATVATYIKALYEEGVSQYNTYPHLSLVDSPRAVYAAYFVNFYQYWYQPSGFEEKTIANISETRANDIKTLFESIKTYIEAEDLTSAQANIDTLVEYVTADAKTLDDLGLYATEIEKTETNTSTDEAGQAYYLSFNRYAKANNIDKTKISYVDVAEQIGNLLNEGVRRYEAAVNGTATGEEATHDYYYTPFTNSYGSWYETSGFEKKTMAYISGSRVTAVELEFAAVKSAVNNKQSVEDVQKVVDKLIGMLETDGKKLDNILGSSSGAVGITFVGCFTIILREGLEAILILGAIVAYLIKVNNKKAVKFVYIGAIVAVVASIALAALLFGISQTGISTAIPQEIIEGVTALIAVAVLIYVSNWMISKSESEAWTGYIASKVSDSSSKGKVFSLAFTSFLAVFREGAEVILFYQPLVSQARNISNGYLGVFGGLLAGAVIVLIVFLLIRIFSIKIPLKPFFMATSILMAVMSIIFLGSGIWELFIDGGIWPTGIIKGLEWMAENDILNFLGIYPTWLTIIPQIILTIITIITFVLWIRKGNKKKLEAQNNNSEATVEEINTESSEDLNNEVINDEPQNEEATENENTNEESSENVEESSDNNEEKPEE